MKEPNFPKMNFNAPYGQVSGPYGTSKVRYYQKGLPYDASGEVVMEEVPGNLMPTPEPTPEPTPAPAKTVSKKPAPALPPGLPEQE